MQRKRALSRQGYAKETRSSIGQICATFLTKDRFFKPAARREILFCLGRHRRKEATAKTSICQKIIQKLMT
jgi:hypothetical protein